MKIHTKDFRVDEGDEVDLKKWPTKVDAVYKSKSQYKKLLEEHVEKLSAQQQLLYADNRHAILLIFQAMDAAGKDGAIRHVMSGVNPQGCQVFSFKHPSATELEHDFLWRTTRDLPARGKIGIFNRSYYEEVLIVRVHRDLLTSEGLPDPHGDKKVWHDRYRSIVDLEKHLHANGTRIVKFFLHLSKDEQRKRFLARIDEPEKNWKFSLGGYRGAEVLEALHGGLWRLPERDKHRTRALVCRARRRQGERAPDRVADCSRHLRGAQNGLPQDDRRAPQGIAGDPQAAREVAARPNRRAIEGLPPDVLAIEAISTVTHDDYRSVLIPKAEAMMAKGPIKMLYVIGNDFKSFELEALWDDGTFGIKHWRGFDRVAVVTDHAWLLSVTSMFTPFFPGEVLLFGVSELPAAKDWIASGRK